MSGMLARPCREAFSAGNHGALRAPNLAQTRCVHSSLAVCASSRNIESHVAESPSAPDALGAPHQDELDQQRLRDEARQKRKASRHRVQLAYKVSAIAATALFFGLSVFATYYRFFYHSHDYVSFPYVEFWATIAMIGGGIVAMEMYARWAHRVLWHDFQPGWRIHASHHEARVGAFEANDIFAVANALPAFALTAFGFFTPSLVGGLSFGFGMGITVFGILYMFVHDGLVHKRFPVGPIAEMPQLKRIAIAHRLHHSEKYNGVPYGMFLGPQELEAVGAKDELDRLVEEMKLSSAAKKRSKAV